MPYIIKLREYYTWGKWTTSETPEHNIYIHKETAEHAAACYMQECLDAGVWQSNFQMGVEEVDTTYFEEVFDMTKDEITRDYGEPFVAYELVKPSEEQLEMVYRDPELDI